MAAVRRRLAREIQECIRDSSQYFKVWPKDETLLEWEGIIHNLPDERHAGKEYSLNIKFSENYPFEPPVMRFTSRVKCENILRNGYVCMDILYNAWSPAFTVSKLMLSVTSLLTDAPITGLDNKDVNTFLQEIRLKRIEEYRKKYTAILSVEPRTANEFIRSVEEMKRLDRERREMSDLDINCIPENVIVPLNQTQDQLQVQKRRRRTELEMLAL